MLTKFHGIFMYLIISCNNFIIRIPALRASIFEDQEGIVLESEEVIEKAVG